MTKTNQDSLKISTISLLLIAASSVLFSSLGFVSDALAQATSVGLSGSTTDDNALSLVMCKAARIITGTAGKTFAAFAIISVGIGFFTGKVSWGLMIGVAAGIAAMFGAPSIVAAISGTSVASCVY